MTHINHELSDDQRESLRTVLEAIFESKQSEAVAMLEGELAGELKDDASKRALSLIFTRRHNTQIAGIREVCDTAFAGHWKAMEALVDSWS